MSGGPARGIVLGSAAGGGVPQWNCRCHVCSLAWAGDPRVQPRTQSGLALTGDGQDWVLINASPDLGQQIRATPDLWPRGGARGSPIVAVVLTSAEIDQCAGLLTLREGHSFRLLATAQVHAALESSRIFDALDPTIVARQVIRPGTRFGAARLSLELVPVPGKAALYVEGGDPEIGLETGETVALWVQGPSRRLAYVPGCAELTDALLDRLAGMDVILFDGTVYSDDEMKQAGVGAKTGRRMGHMPISGAGGSLDLLARLPAQQKAYVHLNNTNPALVEGSPERRTVEAAGLGIAADGLEIRL